MLSWGGTSCQKLVHIKPIPVKRWARDFLTNFQLMQKLKQFILEFPETNGMAAGAVADYDADYLAIIGKEVYDGPKL